MVTNATILNVSLSVMNGTTAGQLCPDFHHTTTSRAMKATAYSVLFVLSLVGNCLILATVYRRRELRNAVNYFIANMAFSDLFVPIFIVPLVLKNILVNHGVWLIDGPFGLFLCKFVPFASWVTKVVSVLNLTIIALERFHRVVFAHRLSLITKKRCFKLIIVTWVIAIFFFGFAFYTFRLSDVGDKTYCNYSWEPAANTEKADRIVFLVYIMCFVVIPLFLITFFYTLVLVYLRRHSSAILSLGKKRQEKRKKRDRRITMMLITVVVYFFITWVPWCTYMLAAYFVKTPTFACGHRNVAFATLFLSDSYTAANPVIYYALNESYRKGFRDLLCCVKIRLHRGSARLNLLSTRGVFSLSRRRTLSISDAGRRKETRSAPRSSYKPRSRSINNEEYELPILSTLERG